MAGFEVGEVVDEVRRIIQDKAGGPVQRLSDNDMLGFVNQSLRRIAVLRPDLFAELVNNHPAVPGTRLQSIPDGTTPAGDDNPKNPSGFRLIDLYSCRVVNDAGENIVECPLTEADQETFRRFIQVGAGNVSVVQVNARPRNFFRDLRVYKNFHLDAPPDEGAMFTLSYAKNPEKHEDINGMITDLEPAFMPVVVDATVFVAASMDDESVNSRRAEFFYRSFTEMLGVSLDSRPLTDVPYGGVRNTVAQGVQVDG